MIATRDNKNKVNARLAFTTAAIQILERTPILGLFPPPSCFSPLHHSETRRPLTHRQARSIPSLLPYNSPSDSRLRHPTMPSSTSALFTRLAPLMVMLQLSISVLGHIEMVYPPGERGNRYPGAELRAQPDRCLHSFAAINSKWDPQTVEEDKDYSSESPPRHDVIRCSKLTV